MNSRQMPCPACAHEHCWLDCDWCECKAHIQLGIYPQENQ